MRNPYQIADRYAPGAKEDVQTILANLALRVCSFDEINQPAVQREVREAFLRINTRMKRRYRRVIEKTYAQHGIPLTRNEINLLLLALLRKLDPTMGYRFDRELTRKRDRLTESILSNPRRQEIRRNIKKALPNLELQTVQFLDIAVDDSHLDAMRRQGVKHVMWVTEGDERVCATCDERNGNIYSINSVPPKPHPRCRCTLEPVSDT